MRAHGASIYMTSAARDMARDRHIIRDVIYINHKLYENI